MQQQNDKPLEGINARCVSYLRSTNVSSHIELPLHPVNNDVQMQLPHALNDSLVGLIIPGEVE